MKMSLKWNKSTDAIAKDATGGDDTLLFMASEMKRLMEPYVPDLGGVLYRNARVYTEKGQGVVEYMSPHARFQYGGKVMVSSITGSPWARSGESKVVTSKDLNYTKLRHPLATSHWDKAMLQARKSDYESAVQAYVQKKGG